MKLKAVMHGVFVIGLVTCGAVQAADAQSLDPFGNPFSPLVNPSMATRIEVGAVSARQDKADAENDFAMRVTRKIGKTSAVSASVWGVPRANDSAAMFQVGAVSQISQRTSVWMNFGGSPTSEHMPNAQYDFGASYGFDPQLIVTAAASIRNYQGGPSVRLLVPGVVWIVNPKVILAATAVNSTVSRLAPGVSAGSNSALFNVILTPHPMLTLNLGTGYGESDFLLAAVANQNLSQNKASANFDAAATVRFSATRGLNVAWWLDKGNGSYKTNTFQASFFVEF